MIDGITNALLTLFEWPNPLLLAVGVLFGFFIGILPGLGGAIALVLLIPTTITMGPESAIILLMGAYSVSGFGGMLTSILMNIPGDAANAATTMDGYPLTKQGRAAEAIGAATAASFLGGMLGAISVLALLPLAQRFILSFSYPEFALLAVVGLTVIAVVTKGNVGKGLVAAGLGLMLAFIGLDPLSGAPRFTFDQLYLWDGINTVPALVGLFAGAEILALFGTNTAIGASTSSAGVKASTFGTGVFAALHHWFLLVRASIIGTVIGVIPGVGGSVASFMAYGHAVQSSKSPERFGKGAIEGVIAAESANDAKEGGSLLPTMAFGIPGSTGMAIILGALVLHGIPVGPSLMREDIDIAYLLIVAMVAPKVVAPFVTWAIGTRATVVTTLRPSLYTPLIAVAGMVGAFAGRYETTDMLMVLIFGYIGYGMRKYNFSRIAVVIALVLGDLVERSYHQTVSAFGVSGFVQRPISAFLLAALLFFLLLPLVRAVVRRARPGRPAVSDTVISLELSDEAGDSMAEERRGSWGEVLFLGLLVVFLAVLASESFTSLSPRARLVPAIVVVPTLLGALTLLLHAVVRVRRGPGRHDNDESSEGPSPLAEGPYAQEPVVSIASGDIRFGVADRTTKQVVPQSDPEPEEDEDSPRSKRRQAVFALWTIGFFALCVTAGVIAAIFPAVLFFYRVINRDSWITSLLFAGGTLAFIYGVFAVALQVQF